MATPSGDFARWLGNNWNNFLQLLQRIMLLYVYDIIGIITEKKTILQKEMSNLIEWILRWDDSVQSQFPNYSNSKYQDNTIHENRHESLSMYYYRPISSLWSMAKCSWVWKLLNVTFIPSTLYVIRCSALCVNGRGGETRDTECHWSTYTEVSGDSRLKHISTSRCLFPLLSCSGHQRWQLLCIADAGCIHVVKEDEHLTSPCPVLLNQNRITGVKGTILYHHVMFGTTMVYRIVM